MNKSAFIKAAAPAFVENATKAVTDTATKVKDKAGEVVEKGKQFVKSPEAKQVGKAALKGAMVGGAAGLAGAGVSYLFKKKEETDEEKEKKKMSKKAGVEDIDLKNAREMSPMLSGVLGLVAPGVGPSVYQGAKSGSLGYAGKSLGRGALESFLFALPGLAMAAKGHAGAGKFFTRTGGLLGSGHGAKMSAENYNEDLQRALALNQSGALQKSAFIKSAAPVFKDVVAKGFDPATAKPADNGSSNFGINTAINYGGAALGQAANATLDNIGQGTVGNKAAVGFGQAALSQGANTVANKIFPTGPSAPVANPAPQADTTDWAAKFKQDTGTAFNPKSRMDIENMRRLKAQQQTMNHKQWRMSKSAFVRVAMAVIEDNDPMIKEANGWQRSLKRVFSFARPIRGKVFERHQRAQSSGKKLLSGNNRMAPAAPATPPTVVEKGPNFISRNSNFVGAAGAGLGGAATGWMGGRNTGYNSGYETGQTSGFNAGQDLGKNIGYQLAAGQAKNTGIFGRLMGNYDFDPNALQGAGMGLSPQMAEEMRNADPMRSLRKRILF